MDFTVESRIADIYSSSYVTRPKPENAGLEGDPFIGFSEEMFPGRNAAICAGCQAAGFTPRFQHQVENLTALLALVAAGKGVTLAPAEVSHLAHPQAVFVPLKPPVPSVISAAARRQDDTNPLLKELLECCRDGTSKRLRASVGLG